MSRLGSMIPKLCSNHATRGARTRIAPPPPPAAHAHCAPAGLPTAPPDGRARPLRRSLSPRRRPGGTAAPGRAGPSGPPLPSLPSSGCDEDRSAAEAAPGWRREAAAPRQQPAHQRSCWRLFWSTSDRCCHKAPTSHPQCTAFSGCYLSCSYPSPSTQPCGLVTQCLWVSTCSVFSWNGNLAQFVPWSSWRLYSSSATAAGGTASCITAQDPSCQNQLTIPALWAPRKRPSSSLLRALVLLFKRG